MPELLETQTADVEQPATELPEPAVSIADHAAQFSPEAIQEQAEQPERSPHPSENQRRDKANGQFRDGRVRHRAKSQQASPEDSPRISALTARAKTAEEKLATAEAELARLRTTHAPQVQIAEARADVDTAQARVDRTPSTVSPSDFAEPEPKEDDPKFGGDYGKYYRAVGAWEARKVIWEDKQTAIREAQQAKQREAHQTLMSGFAERMEAARKKHPDFDTVTANVPWLEPSGKAKRGMEAIDSWVMEHKAGPDVLHYLQSHPQERDSLMQMPVLEQIDHLSLLSQRLLSTSSTQAGVTGSAAGRQPVIKLPPTPPNPVRTEAQGAGEKSPPTDGSLSIAEHGRKFAPKARGSR